MTGVDEALAKAAALAPVTGAERRARLDELADALEAASAELVPVADRETRLGVERLTGEVARAAGQLRFYGEQAQARLAEEAQDTPLGPITRTLVPLGPVAVFGASNFPFGFGVLGNDTASALAAGCPVVVKAHPAHPKTSRLLGAIAAEILGDWFTLVEGFDAGLELVDHPLTAAVAFTGSQAGGMALWRRANERDVVIPVYAEMGTVNPVVVTPAAAADFGIEAIAKGFVGSFTLGAGQFCTKPGLMLAPRGAAEAVARALTDAAPAPVMLTQDIADRVASGLAEFEAAGARVLATVPGEGDRSAPAAALAADLGRLTGGSRLLEECFGAVAIVAEYDDVAEVGAVLARLQGALSAALWATGDDADAPALLTALTAKVGRVVANGWPTGVAVAAPQHHGGPWPSTSQPGATSVGAHAIDRFVRPVALQGVPQGWRR